MSETLARPLATCISAKRPRTIVNSHLSLVTRSLGFRESIWLNDTTESFASLPELKSVKWEQLSERMGEERGCVRVIGDGIVYAIMGSKINTRFTAVAHLQRTTRAGAEQHGPSHV